MTEPRMSNTLHRFGHVLYRILGNSLPPRHSPRQTLDNLSFILEHEPQLPGCDKRWVVNRIIDPETEAECIRLIEQAGHQFIHFPVDFSGDYATRFLDASGMPRHFNPLIAKPDAGNRDLLVAAVEWVYRHKNLCAININGARNAALSEGRKIATWTLPWDGSCFFSTAAWDAFEEATRNNPEAYHIVVPLARVDDPTLVLDEGLRPSVFDEPQIAFRAESLECFDERLRYGFRNKAELLRILGVPGPWQNWNPPPWEKRDDRISTECNRFVVAGWVFRLPSGAAGGVERNHSSRSIARFDGAGEICDELDRRLVNQSLRSHPLTCYSRIDHPPELATLGADLTNELRRRADLGLGLPLLVATRNGFQIASFEQLVRRCCELALAGRVLGDWQSFERGADQLRAWFLDPETRINPNVNDAEIMDLRAFWSLLDAIRLVTRAGCLTKSETVSINDWFRGFLDYLLGAARCKTASSRLDSVGTWSNVLTCSVAAFVGDVSHVASTLSKAPIRLLAQLDDSGLPTFEMTLVNPLHHSLISLQGWIALAWIGRSCGINLWRYSGLGHRNLAMAARAIAVNRTRFPDYAAAQPTFDKRITAAFDCIPDDAVDHDHIAQFATIGERAVLDDPDFGLAPFWPALCGRNSRTISPK